MNVQGHYLAARYRSHEYLSWSRGSYANRFPPLVHPLHELKLPQCLSDYQERNPTKITTLPNGIKIASEDVPGSAAGIGIFIDSGSIYEREESTGVTHLLERLAFKATKNPIPEYCRISLNHTCCKSHVCNIQYQVWIINTCWILQNLFSPTYIEDTPWRCQSPHMLVEISDIKQIRR